MSDTNTTIHPFEQSGLGKAPFNYDGCQPHEDLVEIETVKHENSYIDVHARNVGRACQHCGTFIRDLHWYSSSDGKRFFVGYRCGEKGEKWQDKASGYNNSKARLQSAKRKIDGKRRKAREARKLAQLDRLLESVELQAKLKAQSHPNKYRAEKGATLADYAVWMRENSGTKGKLKLLSLIQAL